METYAVVTPARNERENLERLSAALIAQTLTPQEWVIVDDGSDDGTGALAAALSEQHPWVRTVGTGAGSAQLTEGRRHGRAIDSFRHGVHALAGPADVVVKIDADTSFEPDYFERLLARFEAEPDLGIAGGACYELEEGQWVRQKVVATHPRGASRAYRWECLDTVMTLEAQMGWDGLDEVRAAMRGYRSATILELPFYHHRKTGGRERSSIRHWTAQGRAAWYMGYRPSYVALRSLYRSVKDPGAFGMIVGFARAAAERAPRHPEPDVIRHLRAEQRLGAILRRGSPP